MTPTPKPASTRRRARSAPAAKPADCKPCAPSAPLTPLVTPQLQGLALGIDNECDFLRAVADSVTEPFYVWSVGGLLLMANRGWEEATGIPRGPALGKSCSAIFPTLMAKRFLEVNRLVIERGQPVREEEFVDKPEGRVLYLTLKFPIRDKSGRIVAVGGISLSKKA
ncbi:MAG: sensory box sensor histidine kinase/response regulator [Limisphaerales bacterium]|nr:MAG: sensory box sensor histidine kinase/response regulator [Limisphaerales bacterium]TXT48384.1 MAG: sensory box sensor histidine kinase/response regulator [Limisphaerales bacterium]